MQQNSISRIQPVLAGTIGKANTVDPKSAPPPPPPPPPPPADPPSPVTTTTNNYYSSSSPGDDYGYGQMAPVTVTPQATVPPTPTPPVVADPIVEKKEIKGLWGMDLGTTLTVGIALAGLIYIVYTKQNADGNTSPRIKK